MIDYGAIDELVDDKLTVPTLNLLAIAEPQTAFGTDNTKFVSLVPVGKLMKIVTLADMPETSVVLRWAEAALPCAETERLCRELLKMARENNSLSYWIRKAEERNRSAQGTE